MRSNVRERTLWLVLLSTGLAIGACGGDGGEPTPPRSDDVGEITGRVTRANGSGLSGVTVGLSGAASRTVTTSSSGGYAFTELEPGGYVVTVSPPGGYALADGASAEREVAVSAGDSRTVDFLLVSEEEEEEEPSVVVVQVVGTSFSPSSVTISSGQTVRWVNASDVFHTVTPDGHSEWSSASLSQEGQTFEHTFETVGDFQYFCQPHLSAGMTGRVVVQ